MKDFNELQDLWKQQKQNPLPDVSQIITKAKKEQRSFANKIFTQLGILLVTLLALGWIVSAITFKMTTTYIGIALIFTCVFGFTVIRLYQALSLKQIDVTAAPSETLIKLEKFYKFQQLVGTKIMAAYFLLMNLAFGFYFIEIMAPMSALLKIIILSVYVGWMLFAYFYLGKKQKAREYARTQQIIDSIKEMERNYEE
ncbi:hypothetical protein [Flavobacterium enshiense]|uniref:Uncharacterized protein n=1 Tax=Flavobacterium enshiense DK69 TaxID=1107311 RepID=A0A0A2N004_9FLAO|nr:hypothetical protein [Flavobacterium enshiense]KGO97038.1 hypothetical protein Q767_00065 [Flavobacterium enshiense DK69]